MRQRRLISAAALAALGSAVAGCGASGPTASLSASAAGALTKDLTTVQADAAQGDVGAALSELRALSALVARDADQLTPGQRTALDSGLARLRSRLSARTAPATVTTATTPTVTTTTTATATATASTPATTPTPSPAPNPPKTTTPPKPGPAGQPGPSPGHGQGQGQGPAGNGPPGKQGNGGAAGGG
jgi:outer membrane biosynthesis protein TonB